MSLDLDRAVVDTQNALTLVENNALLENKRARFLGKSGMLTDLLKDLDKSDPRAHKTEGTRTNQAKSRVEEVLAVRR